MFDLDCVEDTGKCMHCGAARARTNIEGALLCDRCSRTLDWWRDTAAASESPALLLLVVADVLLEADGVATRDDCPPALRNAVNRLEGVVGRRLITAGAKR